MVCDDLHHRRVWSKVKVTRPHNAVTVQFWGLIPTPENDWREIVHGQAEPRAPRLWQISPELVQ